MRCARSGAAPGGGYRVTGLQANGVTGLRPRRQIGADFPGDTEYCSAKEFQCPTTTAESQNW